MSSCVLNKREFDDSDDNDDDDDDDEDGDDDDKRMLAVESAGDKCV